MKVKLKDKILTEDSILNVTDIVADEIAKNIPGINIAWGLAKALYGAGMKLRQERAIEWVEMVKNNPSVFTKSVLEDEEFQNGFVFALEKYLTSRVEEKREYLKNVFLGFAKSEFKDTFELERLNDAYLKISPHALGTLRFIKNDIFPFIAKNIKKSDLSEKQQLGFDWGSWSFSGIISKWIHDTYNPGMPIDQIYENESEKRKEIFLGIDELISLGILKIQVATGKGGMSLAGGASYDFSAFGYEFLEYLESKS